MKRRAVFLDRDGTIMEEVGYCGEISQVQIYAAARRAIERLHEAGFLVVLITNQSGIGHGYFTEAQYHAVHAELVKQLAPVRVDGVYFAPETPDATTHRRKPGTGMVLEAAEDLDIDLARSYFVGDRAGDVECGHNAGMPSILVETGYGMKAECTPDYRARDLTAAVDWILKQA